MIKFQIDEELTPENSKEKGFEWWQDTIYDPEAPEQVNNEFIALIKKGWKLGKPASKGLEQNCGVGLYKPLMG